MTFKYSEYQKTLNSYIHYSTDPMFEDSSNANKYSNDQGGYSIASFYAAVLAPNGKIYVLPYTALVVLEVDTILLTITPFGNTLQKGSFRGGVLAPNGKIYCVPYNGVAILEIDPVTKTTPTFGSFSGTQQWWGAVLAPNGKIYGIPYDATSILEIDPIARTTTTFGSFSGTAKWKGGVLGSNGIIYGIPYNSTNILKIDPITQTTTTVSSSYNRFEGGVLGPDGKIYCMPNSDSSPPSINDAYPKVFDPITETSSILAVTGNPFSFQSGFQGGVLASNGKIYSSTGDRSMIIDPITQSWTYEDTNQARFGITPVMGTNGKLYSVGNSRVQEYEPVSGSAPADWLLSAYQNKF